MTAGTHADGPRLVLAMIVKDEAPVIERCIASLRPLVDAWCVVDTGSTDGTQERVRRALTGLPGMLHQRPWVDFAHNRTEALDLARPLGDYTLMIDADTVCELTDGATPASLRSSLVADWHDVSITLGALRYHRAQITSTAKRFVYRGVLHEAVWPPQGAVGGGVLQGIKFRSETDGARSRNPRKYHDDAAILEAALARGDEPDLAPRYTFYLAQSYRDAGDAARSLDAYERRSAMLDGWTEERAIAWMEAGDLRGRLGRSLAEQLDAYLAAFDAAPWRAEPLHRGARAARSAGRHATAFTFAHGAWGLHEPDAGLFVEPAVYRWQIAYELAIAAYYVGRNDLGRAACDAVLACPDVPEAERSATRRNLGYYVTA